MSTLPARSGRLDPLLLARIVVLVLGAGLLLEGGALLLLNVLGISVGLDTSTRRLNLLHVLSGIALLAVIPLSRGCNAIRLIWAALIAGAFFVALAVIGLTVDQPFGLVLGPGENISHLLLGALALLFGAWALKAHNDRPALLPVRLSAPQHSRRPPVARKRPARRGKSRRR